MCSNEEKESTDTVFSKDTNEHGNDDSFNTSLALRPRVGTYGGSDTKKLRIRTISHQEKHISSQRSSHLYHNGSLSRIKIGSLVSVESGFGSYMVLPPCIGEENYCKQTRKIKTDTVDSETGECFEKCLKNEEGHNKNVDEKTTPDNLKTDLSEPQTELRVSWYVLGVCALILIILGINWMAFPIFYIHFSRAFGSSQLTTGWIGSLQNAVSQTLGLVVSAPVQIFGCKPVAIIGSIITSVGLVLSAVAPNISFLYFSFGVISGIGLSMMNLPCFIIIQQHFSKNRSIATAIAMIGFSLGQIIGPLLLDRLISVYGWRGAMLLFAGVVLNGIPLSMQLLPVPNVKSEKKSTTKEVIKELIKKITDFSLYRNASFTMFCFGFFLVKFNIMGYYQHLSSRMVYLGLSTSSAASLLTITAICTAINRFISGLVGNMKCSNRTVMYTLCVIIGGIDTCLLPFVSNYFLIAVCCGVYGACLGTIMLMVSIVLVDLLGVENIARSTGLFNVFSGVAGLLATPFSGFLFDVSDNYDIPFFVCGGMGIVGGLFSIGVLILEWRKRKPTESTTTYI